MEQGFQAQQKAHRASRTKKSKAKSPGTGGKKHAVAKPGAFARRIRLAADRSEKRAPNPTLPPDRSGGDAAPRIIAVVGPSGVGKSTIIRNLIRHYSKRNVPTVTGPITIVAGHRKRITFIEVGPDLSSMIDAAKVADLVLLAIDASYGFEMETFEFLNILAIHGMTKVMAILTHLDKLRNGKQLRNAKKSFKDRIWAELYNGAKVFYLSGITTTGDYLKREILNLARFISVTKYPIIKWRAEHPYVLADRVEDISPKHIPDSSNRTVATYGYVRGIPLRTTAGSWRIHLAGVGDLSAQNIEVLPDPCPPAILKETDPAASNSNASSKKQRRKIGQKDRVVYAPMAPEVDGIAYDRDAVYINLAPEDIRFSDKSATIAENESLLSGEDTGEDSSDGEGEKMVKRLQKADAVAVDERLRQATLQLVKGGKKLVSADVTDDRNRRRVDFLKDSPHRDSSDKEHNSSEDSSDSGSDSGSSSSSDSKLSTPNAKNEERTMAKQNSSGSASSNDGSSDSESNSADASREELEFQNALVHTENEDSSAQRWKDITLNSASARLQNSISTSKALERYIYGDASNSNNVNGHQPGQNMTEKNSQRDPEIEKEDDFFTPRRKRTFGTGNATDTIFSNAIMDDIVRLLPVASRDWISDEASCARLRRKRFGTGQQSTGDADINDDSDAADGYFEDLETGETHGSSQSKMKSTEEKADPESEGIDLIQAKKVQKKQQFDKEWDSKDVREAGSDEEDDAPHTDRDIPNVASRKALRDVETRAPDIRKLEREKFEKLRSEEFGDLDAETRIALEGISPGQYVRMELQNVPVEFVKYFNPMYPVILGGLKPSDDEGNTIVRASIRRHRFKRGVLKSTDPVVMSIGWRRLQTIPIYDIEDQGGRRRYLKYTPEHLHCNASFWAPSVTPGAGLVICQSLGREKAGFRIAGTGVVTELDTESKVVKKLKLVGEPVKMYKNTAFVKGMFNSELEVSKYIGASIRTVSGIRGVIKKAISANSQGNMHDRELAKSPGGTFRAGFEDKILLSDIVFLRAWVPVEVSKFCSIATTLLEKRHDGSGSWRMRTIREVREAKELPIPLTKDSLYSPIERARPVFAPLKLSKKLEGSLPYASKPKQFASKNKSKLLPLRKAVISDERALVLDEKERKEQKLLQAVYTIRNDRTKRRKEVKSRSIARRNKELEKAEAKYERSSKEKKKRKFALDGAREAREAKRKRG